MLGLNNVVVYQKLQISGMEEKDGVKCRGLFKFRKRLRESKCRFANLRISENHTELIFSRLTLVLNDVRYILCFL